LASVTQGTWVLERCASARFPFRVQVLGYSGQARVRPARPGPLARGQPQHLCLREKEAPEPGEVIQELERVPIIAIQRRGVRVSLVLDRGRYKRCDFLFIRHTYKQRPNESYEQIYWQTQTSMVQRRPTVVPLALRDRAVMTVRVGSDERYPWRFPGCEVERGKLASGDYALMQDGAVRAVVERKTFDNLLHDFGVMPVLHQRLLELSTYTHNAMVVEAPYEDFLNPAKVHNFTASFCAAAIAELYAAHPRLRIVFCSNRKTANQWTARFFAAVNKLTHDGQPRPASTETSRTANGREAGSR
jgi:hypothetical protein